MTDGSSKLLITALIKPTLEGHVVRALHDLPHFPGFPIHRIRGQGRRRGAGSHFRATEYNFSYREHLQIEIDLIARAARTGSKGDGVILTQAVADFLRIRVHGRLEGISE